MNKDETLKSLENAEIELTRFVEIAKIMASGIEPENKSGFFQKYLSRNKKY